MEFFQNAKSVRLKSVHNKYLTAEEDEESITQDRNGAAKNAKWAVEFSEKEGNIIRLKSCFKKYLTASNHPFLLGMTGRKVIQSDPGRVDSSVEWELIKEGNQVKLKTRYGQFLRANGGLPPWRNSVTHDIPHRTSTQDWVVWEVHVVEILVKSPPPVAEPPPPPVVARVESFSSDSNSPSTHSIKSETLSQQEIEGVSGNSPPKISSGRMIYYKIADENGENIKEGFDEVCIRFKGNSVEELKIRLEEETGVEDIVVCTKSPLNGRLYPLRLHLPPNNSPIHVVVVPSSVKAMERSLTKSVRTL